MSLTAVQQSASLIDRLPDVRGRYRENAPLADTTWFRAGGAAEVLFRPEDADDLAQFICSVAKDIPITILGVGSNVIIRDGGVDGVVIRLGRGFTHMEVNADQVIVGAANLDVNVAQFAADNALAGLEFLCGIPGTIGGALAMNAGAYGREIKDVLVSAEAISPAGEIRTLTLESLNYSYRQCGLPQGWIFTKAVLRGAKGDAKAIHARMEEISKAREETQPVRARTGGSTFKNPSGNKAWELIDAAGCRGMMVGEAQVSEKHCNFLINTGSARASDLEDLGETVRQKVKSHSGIELQWEIKRIGKKQQ